MTIHTEITAALHGIRTSLVQDLVNVAAQRIRAEGKDHGPVLITCENGDIDIPSLIDEVGQILRCERLFIHLPGDGQSFQLSIAEGAEIEQPGLRFVVLTGWEVDRAGAATYLAANFHALHASNNTILIVYALGNEEDDFEDEIGRIIGNELWREMSKIHVEVPAILDEDAIDIIASAYIPY